MYKFTKEKDGDNRVVMQVSLDANIEEVLKMFKYFLLASGFDIRSDEEVVIFIYDDKKDLIGTHWSADD